ncbi:MAG: polyphosphate polymerase domain-containing protein [Fibrobacter sp.]|jgi:hypothetical protein|nr:polyphosphate polymerase domain-containing protein [Fibrobacter sp.]
MSKARGFSTLERFELKYHIPVSWADRIGELISPYCEEDHYSKITPGRFYWITNLYLDSPQWTFMGWKNAGLLDRFNMRIRTYGEHPDPKGVFHFEVKRKVNRISYKSRATLKGHNPSIIFDKTPADWPELSERDALYLKDFVYKTTLHNAKPRLLTQYKRRAWFGLTEDYSRVTIDTGMRFREENAFDYSVDPKYMHSTGLPRFFSPGCDAVLELKAPASQVPYWMIDLIKKMNLKLSGFSKFGNAVNEWKRVYENPSSFRTPFHSNLAGNFFKG